jgi:hypothetical protein
MTLKRFQTITRKTFTGFMTIWFSGVVFLVWCISIANAEEAGKTSCPLAKASEHCKKSAQQNAHIVFAERTESESPDCCAILPILFDKVRKLEKAQEQPVLAATAPEIRFKVPQLLVSRVPIPRNNSDRLFDRQDTFVRNCVFRI